MTKAADLDLPSRLSPNFPAWLTQIAVGVASAGAAWMAWLLIDHLANGAAPFAVVFPAVLLATLFGRWAAGAIAAVTLIAGRWYLAYPAPAPATGPAAGAANGGLAVLAVSVATLITIVIAEMFRAAARRATAERDRQIADLDLFLAEFDHRMKNNFAIVTGLLDMQRRRAVDPATADALGKAQMRVESIARATATCTAAAANSPARSSSANIWRICARLFPNRCSCAAASA